MLWLRFMGWLTGRPIVVLIDRDGLICLRLAFRVGADLYAWESPTQTCIVRLLDGGAVEGEYYSVRWRFA